MEFEIRPYQPSDLPAYYRICLLTGDSGKDASTMYQYPDILGAYYSAPYGVLEPDVCFTLTCDGEPCGYVVGAKDSNVFSERMDKEWLPAWREKYPLPEPEDQTPDAHIIRAIHRGYHCDPDLYAVYPAHLHIDLLPIAQGKGWGRKLMQTFIDNLRAKKVKAVHFGVGAKNLPAIGFYKHFGFHVIHEAQWGLLMGMKLNE
ncbi:MAG TPA: GNAT family N-acetyltransferase [Anaerolineaceae bacterium]